VDALAKILERGVFKIGAAVDHLDPTSIKSAGPLIDGPMTRLFPPEQFQFHPLLSDCNKRL
jgi:hypothetical protein